MKNRKEVLTLHDPETLKLEHIIVMRRFSSEFDHFCTVFEDIHTKVQVLNYKIRNGTPLTPFELKVLKVTKIRKLSMKEFIESQHSLYQQKQSKWEEGIKEAVNEQNKKKVR